MIPEKINFNWKKYLIECMKSTEYCCLATLDEKGIWSNPVYFAWDDNLNLYFMSQSHSRHMKSINKNSSLAVSIYSTSQSTFGDVAGIQLDGNAHILADKKEVEKAYFAYYSRKYPSTCKNPKNGPEAYLKKDAEWIFVKIIPKNIYYFDTRFFDEERQKVPKEAFN